MEAEVLGDENSAAEVAAIEQLERSIWRQVDVTLYPSEDEAAAAQGEAVLARSIAPYAYDDFPDGRRPPRNQAILFVAGFGHPPNADAAVWLVKEIFELILARAPAATLSIVGSNPTAAVRALASDRVEITGRVSDDELRARYAHARVALVPLRTGAGVKSKVVEALREGLPLATTTVGVQGLPGVEAATAVADDAIGLAEATVKLLLDDELWSERSRRQVEYAREHFSREAFRKSFLEAIGDDGAKAESP